MISSPLPPQVDRIIGMALDEDLMNGDVTCRLTVPKGHVSKGDAIAKQPLVVSGEDVFTRVMHRVDPAIEVVSRVAAGDRVAPGEIILSVEGPTASVLMAERVALNFLQRLSGVATLTRAYVDALQSGSRCRITDTRKTSPGMRFLERRAVVHGGGRNHRADLGGGILVKENHIAAAGSIEAAVKQCLAGAPHSLRVEIEVETLDQLRQALDAGAEGVLLDNMSNDLLQKAVTIAAGRAILEASGGVSLAAVADIAKIGVDVISVGALTHSYPAADISFLVEGAAG
jgi:nicotinate-nucleotide pyrophosphorylase (carboxylating)